jgi:hypothetical protein
MDTAIAGTCTRIALARAAYDCLPHDPDRRAGVHDRTAASSTHSTQHARPGHHCRHIRQAADRHRVMQF